MLLFNKSDKRNQAMITPPKKKCAKCCLKRMVAHGMASLFIFTAAPLANAAENEYVSVSSSHSGVLEIHSEGDVFTVYGAVPSVEVSVSAKQGFILTTKPRQEIGVSKDGSWAVKANDSIEDATSVGAGSIVYNKITCGFETEAGLTVYSGDKCEVTARVRPPEFGESVSFRMVDGGSVSKEWMGTGLYDLLLAPPSAPGDYTLEAYCGDAVLAKIVVKVIDGHWESDASWEYLSTIKSSFLEWDDESGSSSAAPAVGNIPSYEGMKGTSINGESTSRVPLGSDCLATLIFVNLDDARLLPGSRNFPFAPSCGGSIVMTEHSEQGQVFDYHAKGNNFAAEEGSVDLLAYVYYHWGDKEYNRTSFRVSARSDFEGVEISELQITNDGEKLDGETIYYRPDMHEGATFRPEPPSVVLTAVPSGGGGFPPDKPNGTSDALNPKWVKTVNGNKNEMEVVDIGSESITISIPTRGTNTIEYAAHCGDSVKSVKFYAAQITNAVVGCSHGRGGSNYIEVVHSDNVKFSALWSPPEAALASGMEPKWDFSPSILNLENTVGNTVSKRVYVPVASEILFTAPTANGKSSGVQFVGTVDGVSATVLCVPEGKHSVNLNANIPLLTGWLSSKLQGFAGTDKWKVKGPYGTGKYEIKNEEQPSTCYVGRPWWLEAGLGAGLEYKAPLFAAHPFMVALKAAGVKSGPYFSVESDAKLEVDTFGVDVYGTPYWGGKNSFAWNNTLKVGVELALGQVEVTTDPLLPQSASFYLNFNGSTGLSVSGSLGVNHEPLHIYIDGGEWSIGGLDVNAEFQTKLNTGSWKVDVNIQKTWQLFQPLSGEFGPFTIYKATE